jgi:hypothetical protein
LAPSRSIAVPRDVRREWGEPDIDSQDGTWDSDPNDPMEFYAERGDVCSRDMSRRRRKHTDEVAFSDGDRSPFIKPSVRYLRRLSSATLNLPPADRLLQYHQALFGSQPVKILVLMQPV